LFTQEQTRLDREITAAEETLSIALADNKTLTETIDIAFDLAGNCHGSTSKHQQQPDAYSTKRSSLSSTSTPTAKSPAPNSPHRSPRCSPTTSPKPSPPAPARAERGLKQQTPSRLCGPEF
jgi:hypothetical protein